VAFTAVLSRVLFADCTVEPLFNKLLVALVRVEKAWVEKAWVEKAWDDTGMVFARSLFVCLTVCVVALAQDGPQPFDGTTARLIGVEREIGELRELVARKDADRWRVLWLHQHISERVMAASLQVDATIAQIDNEIARANEVRGFLADKRDRRVTRANLLSALIGGGIGGTSAGLQLSSALTKPAAAVGIGAGAASAGFAVSGIYAQKGGTEAFEFNSNMLAEFFDRPMLPDSQYPGTIWTFLNEVPATTPGGPTRKEELLETWVRVRRIDSLESKEKIGHLSSQPADRLQLTIDDYEDRAAMLQDVRARISFLKRDLGLLLASLPDVGNLEQ
jgi:hypothetical protein